MSVNLPSFDPGSEGTLLDSANAKQVKAFCEAFNDVQVVQGDQNSFTISDKNVVLSLNPDQLTSSGSGELHFNNGDVQIDIDASGVTVHSITYNRTIQITAAGAIYATDSGATILEINPLATGYDFKYTQGSNSLKMDSNGLTVFNGSSNYVRLGFSLGQFTISNGTTSLSVAPSDITHNMGKKTITVCSGGVSKSMDIIASDPY